MAGMVDRNMTSIFHNSAPELFSVKNKPDRRLRDLQGLQTNVVANQGPVP
jgi:hypothetical protein